MDVTGPDGTHVGWADRVAATLAPECDGLRERHLQECRSEVDGELPLRAHRVELDQAHEHLAREVALDRRLVDERFELRVAFVRREHLADSVLCRRRARSTACSGRYSLSDGRKERDRIKGRLSGDDVGTADYRAYTRLFGFVGEGADVGHVERIVDKAGIPPAEGADVWKGTPERAPPGASLIVS